MEDDFLEKIKSNFINNVNRLEIERKFLIKGFPDYLWNYKHSDIEQHYISFEPEVRVRKIDDSNLLTFKTDGSLERKELEIPITNLQFTELKEMSSGSVTKTRYFIEENNYIYELDVYNNIDNLLTVEVEFESQEDAENFSVPEWFGEEITNIKEFKNKNLALKGFPRALACLACHDEIIDSCDLCKGKGGLKITHVDLQAYNEEAGKL